MNQPERLLVTALDSTGDAAAITPPDGRAKAKLLAFVSKDLDYV
jgi:hypothetical protein